MGGTKALKLKKVDLQHIFCGKSTFSVQVEGFFLGYCFNFLRSSLFAPLRGSLSVIIIFLGILYLARNF